MKIETIHESLVNGQRKQMVSQIIEYGLYDFWSDYRDHLHEYYYSDGEPREIAPFDYFTDACISYHRLTNR